MNEVYKFIQPKISYFIIRYTDYNALFMRDGRLVYAFNCASGAVFTESDMPFNEGLWHNSTFSRDRNRGSLKVDQVSKKILRAIQNDSSIYFITK